MHHELAGDFRGVVPHRGALGYLLVVDQAPVQTGTESVGQYALQNVHGGVVLVHVGGGGPSHVQPGQRHLVPHFQFHPAAKGRVAASLSRQWRPRGQVAEVAVNQLQGVFPLEVASHGQTAVGGGVVTPEKVLYVVQGGGIQVFLGANSHPVVRVGQGEEGFLNLPEGHAVGPVFVALPPFVLDHVPLDVEPLLVDGVQQEAHPVRFQPQRQLEVVGRNILPVVGAVGGGGPVQVGADLLQWFEMAAVMVLGPLEHDVLEKVGKAGAANLFVLGAHVVPHVDRHQRDGVVFMQDDVQSVGQGDFFRLNSCHRIHSLDAHEGRPYVIPAGGLRPDLPQRAQRTQSFRGVFPGAHKGRP